MAECSHPAALFALALLQMQQSKPSPEPFGGAVVSKPCMSNSTTSTPVPAPITADQPGSPPLVEKTSLVEKTGLANPYAPAASLLHKVPSSVLYQAPSDVPSLIEYAAYNTELQTTRLKQENTELRRQYERVSLETECLRSILVSLLQLRQREGNAGLLGKRPRE